MLSLSAKHVDRENPGGYHFRTVARVADHLPVNRHRDIDFFSKSSTIGADNEAGVLQVLAGAVSGSDRSSQQEIDIVDDLHDATSIGRHSMEPGTDVSDR